MKDAVECIDIIKILGIRPPPVIESISTTSPKTDEDGNRRHHITHPHPNEACLVPASSSCGTVAHPQPAYGMSLFCTTGQPDEILRH